ncbi:MAG: coproporphyrinogen dehydrogenase HemZ [Clostridia bacterium]|nr:coproporphyrinogen dehydrogenase HemZ [Clostridia bacterium]
MVRIYTDHPEFLNDIADVIRLYLHMEEVVPAEENQRSGDEVFISAVMELGEDWRAVCRCVAPKGESEYVYVHPAVEGGELVQKRYLKRCLKIGVFRAMAKLFDGNLPWGSLTGIRPTRLLRELMEEKGEAEALRFMGEEFDVSPQKLALAKEIVDIQRPFMQDIGNGADVYIGIPFCRTRCLYCSFLSEVRTKKTDMAAYIAALKKDIRLGATILRDSGYNIRSMYMGGGTPTVLTEDELKDVLEYAMEQYGGYGREFTVEAGRPDTITKEKLKVIRSMGAGRISINPQTMCSRTLELVGRSHSPEEIVRAYNDARELGFDSINMDVIAGLPGESIQDVRHTLEEIKRLDPDNLTVHTLAIKRSSRLKGMLEEYSLPDADEAEAMVNAGMQAAEDMGMKPYYMYRQKYMRGNLENVGYAKPGTECMYNIDMMEETVSIMAHGAGAMTKRIFDGECRVERIPNPKDIATYIAKVDAVAEEKRSLYSK